jgi:hypothetical protein
MDIFHCNHCGQLVFFENAPFDRLIEAWFPLTYVLNNLNRALGLPDGTRGPGACCASRIK